MTRKLGTCKLSAYLCPTYFLTFSLFAALVLAYAALTGVNLIVEIKRLGHS